MSKLCGHGHDLSDPSNQAKRFDKRTGSTYIQCKACRAVTQAAYLAKLKATGRKPVPRKRRSHCARGHAMTPENTYERPMRGPQCFICMRASKAKYDERVRPPKKRGRSEEITHASGKPATEAQVDLIFKRVQSGQALYAAVEGVTTPHHYKCYALANPVVHRQLKYLASMNTQRMPRIIAATMKVRTNSWLDVEAVPVVERVVAGLPAGVRETIRTQLLMEIWDGALALADVAARAKRLKTDEYSQYTSYDPWGHRALDAPRYLDGGTTTYGDTLSEGLWDH